MKMATLTIPVDDQLLERARQRAAKEGTSVDAILVRYLTEYVASGGLTGGGAKGFLDLTKDWKGGSGPEGRTWKREDLYEDD